VLYTRGFHFSLPPGVRGAPPGVLKQAEKN